ncbi:DUF4365 domain-containing protein [Burkholderia contaminans]|uniref:DUF4365 domain-containing protein n=1 Tax=Burkholderia contaminans TaxID=488447 RepID=UPI0009F53FF1|nr:DUF4365 domain-containing protein [Burkholderia contaminans]
MTEPANLPIESDGQRIGHRATKCFSATCPESWRTHPLEGTDDAGFDIQTQIVRDGVYSGIFRIQLKGSESPALNATTEYYSVSLSRRTINYYGRTPEPVLLIFCDLSVDLKNAANCPSFYVWIHDELRRFTETGQAESESTTLTVRVPVANRLTNDTDLFHALESNLRLHSVATSLDEMVSEKLPTCSPDERIALLQNLVPGLANYDGSLLRVVSGSPTSPWPTAPKDSIAGKLAACRQQLDRGHADAAKGILEAIKSDVQMASLLEQADYWYCVGKVADWCGDAAAATKHFEQATNLAPQSLNYLLAWAETQIVLFYRHQNTVSLDDLESRLQGTDSESIATRARILATQERYDEALLSLETLERSKSLPTLAIIASMARRHSEVENYCNEGLALNNVDSHQRDVLYMLRARANFNLSMPREFRDAPEYIIASWTGPASLNSALLHQAWCDIVQVLKNFRARGWPNNVEFITDIWGATALMLGRADEAIGYAREAAAARPHIQALQNTLEILSVNVEDYETALIANGRQARSDLHTLRRITYLHQTKRHTECVELLESTIDGLPSDHPLFPVSIALGVLSADRIFRPEIANSFARHLEATPESAPHYCLLKYFRAIGNNVLASELALNQLWDDYEQLGHPKPIALQLLHLLDPTREDGATRCVTVARQISETQQLGVNGEFRLAQAHVTLGDWVSLRVLAERAMSTFDQVGRFRAIRAFALDKLGFSAEALDELRALIATDAYDRVAVDTYVHIVHRSGFVDEAIELTEQMLSNESDKDRRLYATKLLFDLLQTREPASGRTLEVAWAIGQLVDQNDEIAEGQFLGIFLTSAARAENNFDPSRLVEFHQRLERYIEKWPNSHVLRKGSVSENTSAEEFLRSLRGLVGGGETDIHERQKLARQLNRGEIPVPYSWRPRMILPGVMDMGHLWDIGKSSKKDSRQFHLQMVQAPRRRRQLSELPLEVPLLDLSALFIIQDLGLFGILFSVFPKIAISQALLLEIRRSASPIYGSLAQPRFATLLQELQRRFDFIQQPVSNLPVNQAGPRAHLLSDDMKLLVAEGRFVAYFDDAYLRTYATNATDTNAGFCTLDLLAIADQKRLLTPQRVAELLGQLCDWNVGISIDPRYLCASIPEDTGSARTPAQAEEIILRSPTCRIMLEGIWSVRKPYSDIAGLAAYFLASLLSNPNNSVVVISAIIGIWLRKARLRIDVPASSPIDRLAALVVFSINSGASVDSTGSRRLREVYLSVVEMEYGDRMDEKKEAEAIATLAEFCALADSEHHIDQNNKSRTSHFDAIARSWTRNTEPYDKFKAKYDAHIIEIKRQMLAP